MSIDLTDGLVFDLRQSLDGESVVLTDASPAARSLYFANVVVAADAARGHDTMSLGGVGVSGGFPAAFTKALWFKSGSFTSGTLHLFSGHGSTGPYSIHWLTYNADEGKVYNRVTSAGGAPEDYTPAETSTLLPNTWYHITASLSGRTSSVYVNGALASTVTLPEGFDFGAGQNGADDTFALGSHEPPDLAYAQYIPTDAGYVDGVKLYNRALSAPEVAALFNQEVLHATCFVRGTRIAVPDGGDAPIESLAAGDWVVTHTGERQRVAGVFRAVVDTAVNAWAVPVRIPRGVLGATDDLLVSPCHGIIVPAAGTNLGYTAVPAITVAGAAPAAELAGTTVEYYHLALAQDHLTLMAHGVPSESWRLARSIA